MDRCVCSSVVALQPCAILIIVVILVPSGLPFVSVDLECPLLKFLVAKPRSPDCPFIAKIYNDFSSKRKASWTFFSMCENPNCQQKWRYIEVGGRGVYECRLLMTRQKTNAVVVHLVGLWYI